MTKRRKWLLILWVATAFLVTGWVGAEAENATAGNALMVGTVLATVVTVVVARKTKK